MHRCAAKEVDIGGELAGEQQSGLDRTVIRRELATERPVALLQAHGLDRVIAPAGDTELLTGREQILIDTDGELGWNVKFPTQFTHIGDPGGAHTRIAQ